MHKRPEEIHRLRRWRLNRLRIGPRLTVSFAVVGLLILLGNTVALWQFRVTRNQAERLHDVDLRSQTILRVHADVLDVREKLLQLLDSDQPAFEAQVPVLSRVLVGDVDQARKALSSTSSDAAAHAFVMQSLATVRNELPAEIDAMLELARAGDWPAVRARLERQMNGYSEVTGSLVQDIDREVSAEQRETRKAIHNTERNAIGTLLATALLTLLVALACGYSVTSSITQPLASLEASAQALARGDYNKPADAVGNDELAVLGSVFNETAERVRVRTEDLDRANRQLRAEIVERQRVEKDLQLLLDVTGAASTAPNIPALGSACVERICTLCDWQAGQVWFPEHQQDFLLCSEGAFFSRIESTRMREASLKARIKKGAGVLGRVWETKSPDWVVDVQDNGGGYQNAMKALGFRTVVAFPVVINGDVLAVFEFVSREPSDRDETFLEFSKQLGQRIGDIMDRKRAQEELDDAKAELQHLMRMTTMGELAGYIGSELSEPIKTAVQLTTASLNCLSTEPPNTTEAYRLVLTVLKECTRAAEEITRFRSVLRQLPEEPASPGVDELLRVKERLAERNRIANELHDTLLQSIAGISLELATALRQVPAQVNRDPFEKILNELDNSAIEARQAVLNLRVATTTGNELAWVLRQVCVDLSGSAGIRFDFRVAGQVRVLNAFVRDEVYRIAREALTNAFRHSHAERISASLAYAEEGIRFRVVDDGCGIPPEVLQKGRAGHFGISGMRERSSRLGAWLSVTSQAGAGTQTELFVPARVCYGQRVRKHLYTPEDAPKSLDRDVASV